MFKNNTRLLVLLLLSILAVTVNIIAVSSGAVQIYDYLEVLLDRDVRQNALLASDNHQ